MNAAARIVLSIVILTAAFSIPADKEQTCNCGSPESAAFAQTVTNQTHPLLSGVDVTIEPAVETAENGKDS